MASITGITFFYSHDELLGVHPHCSSGDTASSTFERLSYRLKSQTVWIYLPISKSDPITSLGIIVSERPASILRNPKIEIQICTGTQLTGVTVIGSQHTAPGPVECSWKSAPITLVYAKPQERRGVWLSSYGSNQSALLELPITPVIPKLGGETAYYSEAPLDNVSSAVLFLDEKNIYCRGILFRYLDGSCRALGECRVHMGSSIGVNGPLNFCFRGEAPSSRSNTVEVTFEHTEDHENLGAWSCCPMKGTVNFWCSPSFACLQVAPLDNEDDDSSPDNWSNESEESDEGDEGEFD